jgi:hypothetical protein
VTDWRLELKGRYPDQVRCVPSCHDGWQRIVDSAVDLIVAAAPGTRIMEIKQKFGTLRIYCDTPREAVAQVERIVAAAEAQSGLTCEVCGDPGVLYDIADWLAVRCPKHTHLKPGEFV